jgi:pimeloyl-ACP methyl ester carboxylesterase
MTNLIKRHTLLFGDSHELHYSLFQGSIDTVQSSPLLICLHPGWSGESPPDYYGEHFLSSVFIPAFGQTGATIVSPNCPKGAWNNVESRQAIFELLDHLLDHFRIDHARVSIVGYSAGGWGVWYLLQGEDNRFSSAILFATLPVIDPVDKFEDNISKCEELLANRVDEWLSRIPDLPIYIIHSRDDELLPYIEAQRAYQALMGDKRQARFVTIQDVGHFDGESYVEPLHASIPWLIDTWGSK